MLHLKKINEEKDEVKRILMLDLKICICDRSFSGKIYSTKIMEKINEEDIESGTMVLAQERDGQNVWNNGEGEF